VVTDAIHARLVQDAAMRRRRLTLLLAGAVLPITGACNDGDDASDEEVSEDAQPFVDAMVEGLLTGDEGAEFSLDREQAECLAPRWVDIFRVERLTAAGLDPEDLASELDGDFASIGLSDEDGNALYDSFADCDVDVKAALVQTMAAQRDLSDDAADCLRETFPDDLVRRVMVTTFVEGDGAIEADEELTGELVGVFADCPGALDSG
jgi:hypothetical protein